MICPRDGTTTFQETARSGDEAWTIDRCPKCGETYTDGRERVVLPTPVLFMDPPLLMKQVP